MYLFRKTKIRLLLLVTLFMMVQLIYLNGDYSNNFGLKESDNTRGTYYKDPAKCKTLTALLDSNMTFTGNWSFYYENYEITSDTLRDLCFVSAGGGVITLDVTDKSNPTKVSDRIRCRGQILDIYFDHSEENLYIAASDGGLEIWDISDYLNPHKVGYSYEYHEGSYTYMTNLDVQDNYAYVTYNWGGMAVIDISNPANPVEISYYETYEPDCDIAVKDEYAYITDGQLRVIDISEPQNPLEISSLSITGTAYGIKISDSLAFIAAVSGLSIVDISSHNNPVEIAYYITENCKGLDLHGNYVYINNGDIINVEDPANPQKVGEFNKGNVFVYGNHIFTSQYESMSIFDISNISSPVEISTYEYNLPHASIENIALTERYAFLLDDNWREDIGKLIIMNIEDKTAPEFIRTYSLDTMSAPRHILISNNYLYVGDYDNGIRILDIEDIDNIELLSIIKTHGWRLSDMCISNGYLYTANWEAGLQVIDVSDPSNPDSIASLDTNGDAYQLLIKDEFLFLDNYSSNDLQIIDVSNPRQPEKITDIISTAGTSHMCLDNDKLYMLSRGYECVNLGIIDIEDPANPTISTTSELQIDLSDGLYDVEVNKGYAYLISNNLLVMFNVQDTQNIYKCGYATIFDDPNNILLSNNNIFISDAHAGPQIFRNQLLDSILPLISNLSPAPDTTIASQTPTIQATVYDSLETDSNWVRNVVILLNSDTITPVITDTLISYTPSTDLTEGQHSVYLYLEDLSGNSTDTTWSFSVSSNNIRSISPYPNPADKGDGHVNITFGGLSAGMDILIYDISGTLIEQTTASDISYTWDISNKSPGMYIYVIKDENGNMIKGTIGIKK